MERRRYEYVLDLSAPEQDARAVTATQGTKLRLPVSGDRTALATLLLNAYRGTIDDEGESFEDAQREMERYLAAAGDLLGASRLAFLEDQLVSACLAGPRWKPGPPLIWYVLTDPAHQRRGLGARVLSDTFRALRADGHTGVCALITEGNVPSESLFTRLGFQRVEAR